MDELITYQEAEELIMALARAGKPFTEEEADKVLAWARHTRFMGGVLGNLLKGTMCVGVDSDGELFFRAIQHEKEPQI